MDVKKIINKNPLFFGFFFPALMDGIFTLLGQTKAYWQNTLLAHDLSPAYYILILSPWLFIVGSILWFIFWYWLFKRLKEDLKIFFMFLFIAGHSWGSSSWIIKRIYNNYQISALIGWGALVMYFILIGLAATCCLKSYLRRKN